jgi:hypothetical protein
MQSLQWRRWRYHGTSALDGRLPQLHRQAFPLGEIDELNVLARLLNGLLLRELRRLVRRCISNVFTFSITCLMFCPELNQLLDKNYQK